VVKDKLEKKEKRRALVKMKRPKRKELVRIDASMIKDGVLTIPEDITEINVNLDECLQASNIDAEIRVVVCPERLETMGNFFYGNKTVKAVIFNSSVSLFSINNQGTFESCAVETILIPKGFASLPSEKFDREVKGGNIYSPKDYYEKKTVHLFPSFFNCNSLTDLTVVFDPLSPINDEIFHISIASANDTWDDISKEDSTCPQRIEIRNLMENYKLPGDVKDFTDKLIEHYRKSKQITMCQPFTRNPTMMAAN
jgi:hypothetical protein